MYVKKIKIEFVRVGVNADIWGSEDWKFTASINGVAVGNPQTPFTAAKGGTIWLPAAWSAVVNLNTKPPVRSVKAIFRATRIRANLDLGEVSYLFKYPFATAKTILVDAPVQALQPPVQFYTLTIKMTVVDTTIFAPNFPSWKKSVRASRQRNGSTTFTTISGTQIIPRVEVCPVVPTPDWPSLLPLRPNISVRFGLFPGVDTPQSRPVVLWPLPNLNATYNPSLIPILTRSAPDFATKVARLAVTYMEPGNLDVKKLTWKVKSGPSQIVGSNTGMEIQVVGTGAGARDEMTEIEVRWDNDKGTLLARFRAWVGKIKTAMYRINLINGTSPQSKMALPPVDYQNYIEMARRIFWQAGIDLVPDNNRTCWDGASTTDDDGNALPAGIFNVQVPMEKENLTVNVDTDSAGETTRLNCRPGVLHIVFVVETADKRAAATDIQGIYGQNYTLDGTPSSSWAIPSGIIPGPPARAVTMKPMGASNRLVANKADGDDDYVTARHRVDPSFTAASMGNLYAVVVPSGYGVAGDPIAALNVAHELGHVLGLAHRGHTNQAPAGPFGSDDGVDCMGADGKTRGHPWHENLMTYGFSTYTALEPRAQDLDLLQTAVIRQHRIFRPPPPPVGRRPPPPPRGRPPPPPARRPPPPAGP